jgi:alpha-tubulin suppressor-like RCC1 family protein
VALVEAGSYHVCALMESGRIRCWGSGKWGQLGYGDDQEIGDDETPAQAGDVPVM